MKQHTAFDGVIVFALILMGLYIKTTSSNAPAERILCIENVLLCILFLADNSHDNNKKIPMIYSRGQNR